MLLFSFGYSVITLTSLMRSGMLLMLGWLLLIGAVWLNYPLALWALIPLIYLQLSFISLCQQRWSCLNEIISAFTRQQHQFRGRSSFADKPLGETSQKLYSLSRQYEQLNDLSNQLCSEMKFSTHELENLARHTADAASEQQNQLLTIASASEEMSQTVQMIREHVHQTHDNAKSSQQLSQQGCHEAGRLSGALAEVRQQFGETSRKIKQLSEEAQAIQEFANSIEAVAAQTNLLALNAAIEAARAGEAGRGFAVVADEVRQLAGNTERATGDISQLVKTMQSRVEAVSSSILECETVLDSGTETCQQMLALLQQVEAGSNTSLSLISEVNHSIDEHAHASNELSEKLSHIGTLLQNHTDQAGALTELTGYLENLAEKATAREVTL